MKIKRPRTLLGLVLLGLALVTLPLLVAIGNAVLKLGQLAEQSEAVVSESAVATLENQKVASMLTDMERNARQFLVLRNGDLLNLYNDDQLEFERSLEALHALPRDVTTEAQLKRLATTSRAVQQTLRSSPSDGVSS